MTTLAKIEPKILPPVFLLFWVHRWAAYCGNKILRMCNNNLCRIFEETHLGLREVPSIGLAKTVRKYYQRQGHKITLSFLQGRCGLPQISHPKLGSRVERGELPRTCELTVCWRGWQGRYCPWLSEKLVHGKSASFKACFTFGKAKDFRLG